MPSLRSIGVLAAVSICGVYLLLAMRGPLGLPALQGKWHEIRQMQLENDTLRRDVDMRRDRIQRLENNTAEQELEIRKQLKMTRPGETVFILPENKEQSK